MTEAGRIVVRYVYCAIVFFLLFAAVPAMPQDVWINEIEFAPYIIMPEELLYKIIGGENDYLIIDIRPAEDYNSGHIKTAVHFLWNKNGGRQGSVGLPRDREVIIVSRDGEESFDLLRYLLQKGYSDVWVVEGGMQNWLYKEHLEIGRESPESGESPG
ncbi:MAG TPA: rhodanese-like domain-containing protein [Spirochaetota bacterium]|nr:rhodanese-like domain-containing protein [Spirochaetota bacterium]